MGYAVKSDVRIELFEESEVINKELLSKITKLLKENKEVSEDLYIAADTISFELWGNKNIDYSLCDSIKSMLIKNKIKFEIISCEWVESSDGYYYNTED